MATALLGGCTRAVDGTVRAADGDAGPAEPIPLSDLLIEPQRFPAQYPAVVLDPMSVDQAIRDIDGVEAGAVVTPPLCAPRAPGALAAGRRRGAGRRHRHLEQSHRRHHPCRYHADARRDQLSACPSFTTTAGERSATVTATVASRADRLTPTTALQWSKRRPRRRARTLRSLTLVAQVADVQVTAAWMTASADAPPDTQALDALFTDAVLKVRRGGQP